VWTYLANWLVQDGEIPELHPGAVLPSVALRAASRSLRESSETDGVTEHHGSEPGSQTGTLYDITGTVEAACEPGTVLLRVGTFLVVAEPNSVRQVGDDGALERYSPDFPIPTVGTQATVNCTLEVMAAYETEDHYLGVPTAGLARDWRVERLRLGRWALTPTPNGHGDYSVGSLLQVEDTPRMHRWADDSDADSQHLAYLLDLHTT
jgi:hypothetical protein